MKKVDLTKDEINKILIKYMIPSVAGMIGLSMCIFFDTMFIGKGIGDTGLAALNIVIPIFSVFTSIYLLLGVGGATVAAIAIGEKRYKDIAGIFTVCMGIGIISGILLIIGRFLFLDEIAILLGAKVDTLELVREYLGIVLVGGIGFIVVGILSIFVRNDGNPKLSMWSTIGANITNIVLDYIFIFPMKMGMKGAALATALSSITGLAVLLIHLVNDKNNIKFVIHKKAFRSIGKIFRNGLPNFIAELSGGIVIFVFNMVILKIIGTVGIASYSIVCNSSLIVLAIFNGIAQGIQPILGVNYGAKLRQRVFEVVKKARYISGIVALCFYLIGVLRPDIIINIFSSTNNELGNITKEGIVIYFLAFIPMGINIVNIAFLQCTEKANISSLLSTLRGFILSIFLVLILPKFLGIIGFWMAIPLSEIATLIIGTVIMKKMYNKQDLLE